MRGAAARQQHRSTPQIPIPSPFNPNDSAFMGRRDSDASLCSSRPSSAGGRPQLSAASALLSDRGAQSSALRDINAYLSSVSAPFALKPPLPSARDITDCLRLLLSRLDFPIDPHKILDDDLLSVLKALNCPVKLNRSALRAPGTPHSWPALVSVLYWLVQLARYADHHFSSSPPRRDPKDILLYTAESYSLFISGKDDAVAELDNEYIGEMERGAANAAASVESLEKEAAELEQKVMEIRSGISPKEQVERERDLLIEDSKKFESVVGNFNGQVEALEEKLRDFEKELEAKRMESKRICEENEELKKTIEGQAVNARDVEMMRRELQAAERDIAEAENGRSVMDEKAWELEAEIGKKWKELVAMAEQCSQAIRK